MRISGTQVNLNQGAFEIYVAGCLPPRCKGCHNPELWDFRAGWELTEHTLKALLEKIDSARHLIRSVWLLGGEPLDQHPDDILALLRALKDTGLEVWVWTKFELERVPTQIKVLTDYLKCGRYEQDNVGRSLSYGIPMASRNQRIFKHGIDYCTPDDRKKIYVNQFTSESEGGVQDEPDAAEGSD